MLVTPCSNEWRVYIQLCVLSCYIVNPVWLFPLAEQSTISAPAALQALYVACCRINNRGKCKDSSQLLWFFISVSNPLRKGHSNYQNMLEWCWKQQDKTPVVACAIVCFHSLWIKFKLLQLETPLSGFLFTATALKEDIKENLDEGQMRNRERKINFSLRKQHPILPGLKSDKGERGYYIQ